MATQYQSTKDTDSMDDNTEQKLYSDSPSDNDNDNTTPLTLNDNNNNFMTQVHKRRKNSISYTNDNNESESDTETDIIQEYKYDSHDINNNTESNIFMHNRQYSTATNTFEERDITKLRRRHSADIILCKPSNTTNINSVDYLNRMVITLRGRIRTYREDLRIAGELGQNLFSENSKKDLLIEEYKSDIFKLKSFNDELSNVKLQYQQSERYLQEHTKRIEGDLRHQQSKHDITQSEYAEECILLKEQLLHCRNDLKHLEQLRERQRLEIESLETRNEQISINARETIDDLSRELAEEKDGHSILKHKYNKLNNNVTKLKIISDKRGTEIKNLKKEIQQQQLKILSNQSNIGSNDYNNDSTTMSINKNQIKLLYRQIDNYKDEIQGMQKHVDNTKSFLKTTINYLENTNLLKKVADIQKIYTLCKNARQFLGINKPPPDPIYEEQPPELPTEPSPEPLPNDDIPSPPSMPREPTPPLKVSQITNQPLSVPDAPKTPTPPPIQPPSIPIQSQLPQQPIQQIQPIKMKIKNKPSLPPIIPPSIPSQPKPSMPLPPPKTNTKIKSKIHSTAQMPTIKSPQLPAPLIPTAPSSNIPTPSLPNEVIPHPKSKRFSSAIKPSKTTIQNPMIPSIPTQPTHPTQPPSMPIQPKPSRPPSQPPLPPPQPRSRPRPPPKTKINAKPMIPSLPQSQSPPSMPTYRNINNKLPDLVEREIIPKIKSHNLGVMPAQIVDEKPLYIPPSMPTQPNLYEQRVKLPYNHKQEIKKEVRVVNKVMKPPMLPPLIPTQPSNNNQPFIPSPHVNNMAKMESVKGKVTENNKPKRKKTNKKKKSKKPKKERDSMEEQKQHLVIFFSTYSDSKNWGEGGKENGIQKYILKFAEREPLNARMAFLYSMTLYLGQIVGVNKRCITHAFMLFKSVRAQIDTLCEEFALILQTLEHHNDDKLWKYVYSFLYNAAAYFKHIQRFVGTRTSVDNPRKYQRDIKSMSRDYTSRNSSITFRKVSGLSDLSEHPYYNNDNNSNLSSNLSSDIPDKKHQIYGNSNVSHKKSNKKKKKSSYA